MVTQVLLQEVLSIALQSVGNWQHPAMLLSENCPQRTARSLRARSLDSGWRKIYLFLCHQLSGIGHKDLDSWLQEGTNLKGIHRTRISTLTWNHLRALWFHYLTDSPLPNTNSLIFFPTPLQNCYYLNNVWGVLQAGFPVTKVSSAIWCLNSIFPLFLKKCECMHVYNDVRRKCLIP